MSFAGFRSEWTGANVGRSSLSSCSIEIQSSGRSIEGLMEKVLSVNILSSDYFKELFKYKTYHEVVDEIYNQVDHVEPWMTGNCRGPSSAFCLLYKLFTMKLTVKQMHNLLKHQDSPYIRAEHFFTDCYGLGGFS
ncbi:pre-mRNA splicing factor SR-like 1 [Zea mays]|uniref:pre-mRNA splicing factor SR-like 1 n=1 Tax=Zea mays TaxID=4577 RepID=UPI0009AA8545|nr:pre-mRNA splicing factor SR-like 1 [Zea mays]|eukprot:XP_008666663.2 pre-mRNA splicing factor SR-like 1 [Zea mays]